MKITIILLLGIGSIVLTSCSSMKSKSTATANSITPQSIAWKTVRQGELSYLLYLPVGYNAKSQKKWPLMLFLHGAGERGTNLDRVSIHGPLSLVQQGTNFPFIIIAPQCPEGDRWHNDSLIQLLDQAVEKYPVDQKRVYLTGLSMGGYGTWSLGVSYPERFAAIIPICGGGESIDVILANRTRATALKSLPVWAFHGAKDPVVPLEESQRMVKALERIGSKKVKLTVYPEAQHNSWAETYDNPEVFEWLLKQSR